MTKQIIVENSPSGKINLNFGEADSTFKIVDTELPELKPSQVRVKVLYFSNDPTQRTWMAANQDASRSYQAPVLKGDVVRSLAMAEVLESKSDKYQKGDIVNGMFGWSEELVVSEQAIFNKIDVSSGLPLPLFLSSLGMTGLTAYFGLKDVGQLKEGQTVLISAASGATGSMAVQLAKHYFKASKVIGIAGSEEKCEWVKSLGADYCANYREADWKLKLSKYIGTDYVDIYFDSVGGDMLSYALRKVAQGGRVVACGAIAGYNDPSKFAVTTWPEIVTNRLTVQGFIVMDFAARYPEAVAAIAGALKEGKIKASEGASVVDLSNEKFPLEKVPSTWFKLFTEEKPVGKLISKI
ncbi:CIC11C00000003245 [Sungouiella intermedia]|uniref:CIC11C00000003245 n=1 Tax=Sungouiella intermedia TaxID=45354 RepID=A0A1L0DUR1_9ASCO|nr:CIC11C00000003245 [[Candida] intermedia]